MKVISAILGILSIPAAVNAQADTAQIVSVSPGIYQELRAHQKVRFTVKVHYSLNSLDRAFIAVYAERYQDGPDGCDSRLKHQTEGGKFTPITRGERDLTVEFDWHENPGRIPESAASFLGIGTNMWRTERHGLFAKFGSAFFCRAIEPSH